MSWTLFLLAQHPEAEAKVGGRLGGCVTAVEGVQAAPARLCTSRRLPRVLASVPVRSAGRLCVYEMLFAALW